MEVVNGRNVGRTSSNGAECCFRGGIRTMKYGSKRHYEWMIIESLWPGIGIRNWIMGLFSSLGMRMSDGFRTWLFYGSDYMTVILYGTQRQ